MSQQTFIPTDYHFAWTFDWYTWDATAARKAALAARNAEAKRLRELGFSVKCSSQLSLMSKGGIGSGHPHIELWTTVFRIDAS